MTRDKRIEQIDDERGHGTDGSSTSARVSATATMTTATTKTKGQEVAADVAALLRARNPLLWIVTREEARVERMLLEAGASAGYVARTWDVAQGVASLDGKLIPSIGGRDIEDTLDAIRLRAEGSPNVPGGADRGLWILRDLAPWLVGPPGALTVRQVRNLARFLPGGPRETAQALVVVSPSGDVPPELAGHATVIEMPLPDRAEIASILDVAVDSNDGAGKGRIEGLKESMKNGTREAAIDAAVGLTAGEAQACYARSLVQLRRVDPVTVAKEKRRVIARERILEWFDPLPAGLAGVGGLENLKAWLKGRSAAYSPAARAYGLPAPKGIFLVGVPGCGKSLLAKAAATYFGVPLLRFDLGALKSKFVGESEANIRRAFSVIAAIGRCVVWLDEIEKALQGATSGSADGGVSTDALGAILTWMQERTGEAFVIATANDVSALPPELLRKGRFDETFFVDLPTQAEREAILDATVREYQAADRPSWEIDDAVVAERCRDFTGAEIAALVPDAMFAAFADGARPVSTADLLAAAETVVPLATSQAEKIAKLREWASQRARPASRKAEEKAARGGAPALDLE